MEKPKILTDEEILETLEVRVANIAGEKKISQRQLDSAWADIQKQLNTWQDKPDSEGWWWRRSPLVKTTCEYFNDVAVETWDFSGMGKWYKAYIPEEG